MEEEENKFKVGDRVKIAKSSQYYKLNTDSNPRNVVGTITYFSPYSITVDWDNKKSNGYMPYDLVLEDSMTLNEILKELNI